MINCNACGKSIPDDSEFCPFCGNKTTSASVVLGEQLHLYQPSALLARAFLFIEEEEYDKADNYLEAVLNQEPENPQAYLGKLLVEMQVKCKSDLINCDTSFEDSKNYQKILRFADEGLIAELKQYLVSVKKNSEIKAEEERKEKIYLTALDKYNSYDIAQIQEAIDAFASLADYKDSEKHIELCKTRVEEVRIKEENDREKAQQIAKRIKKITIIASPIIVVVLAFIIILNVVIIPNGNYNDAIALMNAGKYEEAISAFEKLDGYRDSEDKVNECETLILDNKYQAAVSLLNGSKYAEALAVFESLNGYKDSATKITACKAGIQENEYQSALALMDEGNYAEAISAFEKLNGYKDSEDKIIECETNILESSYQSALALMNAEKYAEAIVAFESLGGYKDSTTKVSECEVGILENKYQAAISLVNTGKYSDAIVAFEELGEYKDSLAQILACENAITQDYESKYSLSDYTEVTIAEIWNNPSAYNGQKVKIIGYVGCYELDNCFDAYLVKEKDIAKMDTDPDNILETYNYWLNSLKWLHQYIGFRIPLNSYMQQVPSNSPQINAGSKVALYGTFTYNASYVDEGKRTSNAPHGYDILVDKFMVINIG
jgi:tetratricopeptide (TPR) repeat protein